MDLLLIVPVTGYCVPSCFYTYCMCLNYAMALSNNELLIKGPKLKVKAFCDNFVSTSTAGVVPCGIPKKRPRTSSIVQFIFYFWSFEISRNILRNQKTLSV